MATYLDIISLAEAKLYLRVDDTLTDDDAQITNMINSSLQYVEDWTNQILYARAKTYIFINGFVRVYDSPINSITSPAEADMDIELKTLYTNYCYPDADADDQILTLNVGLVDESTAPPGLVQVAYEIIDLWYYEKQTGNGIETLSSLSKDTLNKAKRFIF